MRTSRWTFAGGSRPIGDPEKTEARLLNDGVFDKDKIRPVCLPDVDGSKAADIGDRHLWMFRGREFLSRAWRNYAVAHQGSSEVIAWTEDGNYPKKMMSGRSLPLGFQKPLVAPVSTEAPMMAASITPTAGSDSFKPGTTLYYRFVYISPFGIFAPTKAQKVESLASGNCSMLIAFTRGNFSLPIQSILIFRGEVEGKERIIAKLDGTYVFNDFAYTEGIELASDYQPIQKSSEYIYTFKGVGHESAPSKISDPMPTVGATLIKFDLVNDGFWEQPGLQRIQDVTSSLVLGPLTASRVAPTTGAVTPISTASKQASRLMHGAMQTVPATQVWIGGHGVTLNVDGSPYTKMRMAWSRDKVRDSGRLVTWLMDATDFPADVTTFQFTYGGGVTSWTFDALKGGLLVNLGTNSLGSAEKILFMKLDAPGGTTILNRAVLKSYRATLIGDTTWFTGDMGWDWNLADASSMRWAREGFHFSITIDEAERLADLDDGVFVRFQHPAFGEFKRFGRAFLSPTMLFIQTDTTGMENLNLTTGLSGMSIEYYPANNGIRARAIYRVGDSGEWLQCGEASLDEDVYCDTSSTTSLGSRCSSITETPYGGVVTDEPPPASLRCLVRHQGSLAGLDGDIVRWTRKGAPNAWPQQLQAAVPGARALVSMEHGLLVLTSTGGKRLEGSDPLTWSLVETKIQDGIVAWRSAVKTPHGVVYLGGQGLILTDGHNSKNLTDGRMRSWHFFPMRQVLQDGTVLDGVDATPETRLDSSMTAGQAWISFMESASVAGLFSEDRIFNMDDVPSSMYASRAVGSFANGRYFLFVPAHESLEAFGTWAFNLESGAISHFGLQPFSMAEEGSDLHVLIPTSAP